MTTPQALGKVLTTKIKRKTIVFWLWHVTEESGLFTVDIFWPFSSWLIFDLIFQSFFDIWQRNYIMDQKM